MAIEFRNLNGNVFKEDYKDALDFFKIKIHPDLEKKFPKSEAIEWKKKADKLEKYLKEIKEAMQSNNILDNNFLPSVLQNYKDLFDYKNFTSKQNYQSGLKFEKDLLTIINTYFNEYTKQENLVKNIGGEDAAPTMRILEEDLAKFYGKFTEQATMSALQKEDGESEWFNFRGKQGKIDLLMSESQIEYKYEVSPKIKEFLELLNGSKISAKNYLSVNNQMRVKVGDTSNIKVYAAVLSFLYPNITYREYEKAYFAARKARKKETEEHKKHIKFVYELIGPGLKYEGKDLGTVDYLIINERNGENLKVFSTKYLIYENLHESMGKTRSTHINIAFSND